VARLQQVSGTNNFLTGTAANYSALPSAADHSAEVWVCISGEGVYIFNRKSAGLYYSDGSTWRRLGNIPAYFDSSNFEVYDNTDNTKTLDFDVSNISTGTNRTVTWTDENLNMGAIPCDNIAIDTISTPTNTNQCDFNKSFGSSGQASGGVITDAGSGYVDVSAGFGYIKATDSDTATLLSCDWVERTAIEIPSNTTRYIGITYVDADNSPTVCLYENQDWDLDTTFPLGSIINTNGTLYILNNPWWVTDGITNLIEKSVGLGGYLARDNFVGGLTLGVTATRYPTMTAGTVWGRTNEFEQPSIDLSAATVTAHSAIFDVNNGDGRGTITASTGTPYSKLHDGQRLIISGTGDNDGTYRVHSVVGDNVITFEGVISGTDGTEAATVIQETFATYWFNSDGTVHETTGLTQYPITHWNDLSGAGTLETVSFRKYYVWWVIINITSNELSFIYPTVEHKSAARAEAEAVPSHIPGDWYLEGILIGRIIFKTNTDIPIEVQSVFETTFTASLAADHGNLTGLSDDDHTQYSLVDGTRAFTGVVTGVAPTSDLHLSTKKYADDTAITYALIFG